jgi:hypothetical protein
MAMASTIASPVDRMGSQNIGPPRAVGRPFPAYLAERVVPVLGSAVFIVIAVSYGLWWDPVVHHVDAWWVPGDFWLNYFSTSALIHGHLGTVYAPPTGVVTFPGVLVLLAPAVALSQSLHLSIGMPFSAVSTPTSWLVLEPFDLLAASLALFSLDAVARRLEVPAHRRWILTAAEGVALWDLLVNQWHPEDAFAVALALWALLAAFDGRWRRAGWLLGIGIAFQPLVVLALAAVVAMAPRRNAVGLVARAGVPAVLLLAGPLIANPRVTLRAVIDQPSYPLLDHPTPWIHFAPHLGPGVVATGPARLAGVIIATAVSWAVCRRTRRAELVVWIVAVCFATRSLFESVMVAYYIWPPLALALVVAARSTRARFVAACVFSSLGTMLALRDWRGEWVYWSVLLFCIGAVLAAAWPGSGSGPDSRRAQELNAARAASRPLAVRVKNP